MSIVLNGTKGINQNTTEVTKIPVGTTAQRPENPEAGMIRFNTDGGYVEWYDDATDVWTPISTFPGVAATGGTVTDITQDGLNYRVHTFTSNGTFEVTRGGEVEYLVVAGGGSGGVDRAGGAGGAGGLVEGTLSVTSGTIPVIVGTGGDAVTSGTGITGENSQFLNKIALGGGFGGNASGFGGDGGSGGGNGRDRTSDPGQGLQPASSSGGFGNNGGAGQSSSTDAQRNGGGGGGAGAAGQNAFDAATNDAGDGGIGLERNIDGTAKFYAGGGGGGSRSSGNGGTGGLGGGGNGGETGSENGVDGTANTGGGGGGSGGGSQIGQSSGSGGSGIVIVRYRIG